MSQLLVRGGERLSGHIHIRAAKNAVLPILAACLLSESEVILHNCPKITDVDNMLAVLRLLGCKTGREGDTLRIDPGGANSHEMPEQLVKEMRSSIFLLGPIIGRFNRAALTYPGGCEIGLRPIDLHLKGLRDLNVQIDETHGKIQCSSSALKAAEIHLDYPSVGATENIMMAAVRAEGTTVIRNAAREPEVADLQNFLNAMGAKINGAGTSTIEVQGIKRQLRAVEYTPIPDRVTAGTYMIAAGITGGDVEISNVQMEHMHSTLSKLREAGLDIAKTTRHTLRVKGPETLKEMNMVETLPYPGFPTDMQSPIMALAAVAQGTSIIVENVFENRFKLAAELKRLGANITVKGQTAVVRGVKQLTGCSVCASDLRAGAALALAGLRAEGETRVENAQFIDRGYEDLCAQLNALGADTQKTE